MNVLFHFIPLFHSENLQKWTGAFHVVGTSDVVRACVRTCVCVFEENCHFVFQTVGVNVTWQFLYASAMFELP